MTTATPSAVWRTAMRTALRDYLARDVGTPDHDAVFTALNGRLVNNLTKADLRDLLRIAGIDPMHLRPATATGAPPMADYDDNDTDDNARDLMTPPDAAPAATAPADDDAAIEAEVAAVRSDIMGGGFASLDQKLRDLVVAARKPAVVKIVTKTVTVEVERDQDGTATPQSAPTDQTVTWKKAFGVKGAHGSETCTVWDGAHPDTPTVNPRYVWPDQTVVALTQIKRGKNVLMYDRPKRPAKRSSANGWRLNCAGPSF